MHDPVEGALLEVDMPHQARSARRCCERLLADGGRRAEVERVAGEAMLRQAPHRRIHREADWDEPPRRICEDGGVRVLNGGVRALQDGGRALSGGAIRALLSRGLSTAGEGEGTAGDETSATHWVCSGLTP